MALWLTRAGGHGQHEQRFLENNRIYLTWGDLERDLSPLKDKDALQDLLREVYPDRSKGLRTNHTGQIWAFSHRMQPGDWTVLPSKHKPAIHVAEVTGPYEYDSRAEKPYCHSRKVNWIAQDIPRSNFGQDILYSFGAFMTVCQVKRHDAEQRVRSMAKNGWKPESVHELANVEHADSEGEGYAELSETADLEEFGRDQIAKLILANFKGGEMERLVDAILKAQGYTTHRSPTGPDKGIDILAAPGPMGFGTPRICVQVKSGDSPLDLPTLNQLIGTMANVNADQGLLVSWGGFKSSVDKEKAGQFFLVRLWDQNDLIDQLLRHYDKLDDDLRAEIPLKRIWTVAIPDEGEG